jgi:uncharacterized protein (TIGR02594 family)
MMDVSNLKNPGTRLILTLLKKHEGKEGLKKVQRALIKMGKQVSVDGVIGNISIAAIKSVNNKKLHQYIETVGSKHFSTNTNKTKKSSKAKWIDLAKNELGTKEIHGNRHNPRVLEYHAVSGGFSTDEVPWCGSFVNFVMIKAGHKTVKAPARAKSWLKFGKSSINPVYGSLAVKSRKGGGHVTFVLGQDSTGKYLYCLGGNQHDEVNINKYKKSVFLDFRVPTGFDISNATLPVFRGKAEAAGKES